MNDDKKLSAPVRAYAEANDMPEVVALIDFLVPPYDHHVDTFMAWLISDAHGDTYTMDEIQWLARYFGTGEDP